MNKNTTKLLRAIILLCIMGATTLILYFYDEISTFFYNLDFYLLNSLSLWVSVFNSSLSLLILALFLRRRSLTPPSKEKSRPRPKRKTNKQKPSRKPKEKSQLDIRSYPHVKS